jgi:hypothetical protein
VPISASHVDVCVFSKEAAYEAFVDFRYPRGAWPLDGAMFDQVPTGAMLMTSPKDPATPRRFAFTSAMQLARKLSRDEPGLQGWLQVGIAHLFEERAAAGFPKPSAGFTFPPGQDSPGDWEAYVGDFITAGKTGDLGAMAASPRHALSTRSRLQAWSMVRWMIGKDRKAFAGLVRRLLHADPAESPQRALLGALRGTFNHDLVTLVGEWEQSAKKSRAASK